MSRFFPKAGTVGNFSVFFPIVFDWKKLFEFLHMVFMVNFRFIFTYFCPSFDLFKIFELSNKWETVEGARGKSASENSVSF